METMKVCCLCLVILKMSAIYYVETLQISHTSTKVGLSSVIQCTSDAGNNMNWLVGGSPVGECSGTTANTCVSPCAKCSSVIGSPAAIFSYTISSVSYTSCTTYRCTEANTGDTSAFTLEVTDFSVDNSTAALNPQEPTANTDGNVSITTACIFPTSSDAITINWYQIFVNKENQPEEMLDANDQDIQSYNTTDNTGCSTCGTKLAGKMTVGVTYSHPSSTGDEIKLKVEIIHADFTDRLYYTFDTSYFLAECTDCCCCQDKNLKTGLCGAAIAVPIVLLLFLGYILYRVGCPEEYCGKILLALAVLLIILALSVVVLSGICLGNLECCSGRSECCKVWNCINPIPLAVTIMSGLGLLGTLALRVWTWMFGDQHDKPSDPEDPNINEVTNTENEAGVGKTSDVSKKVTIKDPVGKKKDT